MGMFGLQVIESWVGPANKTTLCTDDGSQTVVKVSHFRSATENLYVNTPEHITKGH